MNTEQGEGIGEQGEIIGNREGNKKEVGDQEGGREAWGGGRTRNREGNRKEVGD